MPEQVHRSTALWEIAQNLWETGMAFRQTGPAKVLMLRCVAPQ